MKPSGFQRGKIAQGELFAESLRPVTALEKFPVLLMKAVGRLEKAPVRSRFRGTGRQTSPVQGSSR
jgi:hypothetical protein